MSLKVVCSDSASTSINYAFTSNTASKPVSGNNVMNGWKTLACQVAATVNTPANKTFVDANVSVGSDTITISSHGYMTGLAFTLTSSGTLPGGLALATPYYAIVVDANTIKVASSLANAKVGTAVDITSAAGGGTHTVNVTALAGGTLKLQKSIDGVNWYDEGSSQNLTVTGNFYFEKADPTAPFYSILVTLTSGQVAITNQYYGKAEIQS